ncbi:hypothetical protein I308_102368 [Cryptococcus tetragattii IND107]|uniref:Uncharacterized protein n=1 Tax=Cryptococcus tetragattii IND107 TaxID=1296105 RepID=A0ABR3BX54_9TREE
MHDGLSGTNTRLSYSNQSQIDERKAAWYRVTMYPPRQSRFAFIIMSYPSSLLQANGTREIIGYYQA